MEFRLKDDCNSATLFHLTDKHWLEEDDFNVLGILVRPKWRDGKQGCLLDDENNLLKEKTRNQSQRGNKYRRQTSELIFQASIFCATQMSAPTQSESEDGRFFLFKPPFRRHTILMAGHNSTVFLYLLISTQVRSYEWGLSKKSRVIWNPGKVLDFSSSFYFPANMCADFLKSFCLLRNNCNRLTFLVGVQGGPTACLSLYIWSNFKLLFLPFLAWGDIGWPGLNIDNIRNLYWCLCLRGAGQWRV